ncbi:MAG: hypothetical protein ACE5M4_12830 [Anaerolineales bacterium]
MSKRSRKTKARRVAGKKLSIMREVDYIVRRAQSCDSRVVTLGPLVFFSTDTGDAWMLDPEDSMALCLARDGSRMLVNIKETEERYAIEWSSIYRIDGDVMTFLDRSGRQKSILGYPTEEIGRAIRRLTGSQ